MKQQDIKAKTESIRILLAAADELLRRAPRSERLSALIDDVDSLVSDARNQLEAMGKELRE